jgi:hypothetical protein
MRPDGSFPVTILYRFGDTDYLSLFYALSRFQFHEFVSQGIEPPRLIGFPTGLSFLYGLPIAAFGDAGIPIADVVISMLRWEHACWQHACSFDHPVQSRQRR